MRKACFFILFVYVFFAFKTTDNDKRNDRQKMHLKGKVKSLHQVPFFAHDSNGMVKKDKCVDDGNYRDGPNRWYGEPVLMEIFDAYGMKTVEIKDSFQSKKYIYKYDSAERMIESVEYKEGALKYRTFFTYDSLGMNTYETNSKSDTIYMSGETAMNRLENLSVVSDPLAGLGMRYYHDSDEFDKEGRKIATYKYDDSGKIFKRMKYYFSDTCKRTISYDYDRNGKITFLKIEDDNSDGDILYCNVVSFFYRFISGDHHGDLTDTIRRIEIYNKNSEIEERTTTYNNGQKVNHDMLQYEYDSAGNWIKRIEFLNGKPVNIIERKLSYY